MRKILSANSFRLRRSKVFWALAGAMLAWGMIAYGMMLYNFNDLQQAGATLNIYFFNGNLYIGAALAIFSAFFIGQQHMEGGLRSMLTVGHSRFAIYLANLLTCWAAGIGFLMAYWLGGLLVGLPGAGTTVFTGLHLPLQGIVWSYMAALGYSALFCFAAMLDSSKARGAVLCLLLAAFLLAGGFATRSGLDQPEFITRFVTDDLLSFAEETIPNPKFLQGAQRTLYECLDALLPSCQALRPVMRDLDYPLSQPVWAAAWVLSLTLAGGSLFQKKNLQ